MKAAIYSRKSKFSATGESIGNQIQLCKDYADNILKTLNITDFIIYEDEGYSGGNTNRPEFKRLLKDATSHKFGVLICYRLDRISRNVADFSTTLELLQNNNIDFISIREQFDTTSPMGRAMIYIASVFAQLERETIAERIKDNMLELSKTGRWLGGNVPLGYDSEATTYLDENKKGKKLFRLVPNLKEQNVVKLIFDKYIKFKSLSKVEKYAFVNSIKTKAGCPFTITAIGLILSNPVYVKATNEVMEFLKNEGITTFGYPDGEHGLLTYNKSKGGTTPSGKSVRMSREKSQWIAAIGSHKGIIDDHIWLEVQERLRESKRISPNQGKTNNALLTGKLSCALCGGSMQISHGHNNSKTGIKTFYYVCGRKKISKGILCNNKNAKVSEIDTSVILKLKEILKDKPRLINSIITQMRKAESAKSFEEIIQSSILEKERQIENLLNQLCKNDDLSEEITWKIRELKTELLALKNNLNAVIHDYNKDLYEIGLLKDIPSIIDFLSLKEKKELIWAVLNNASWNGFDQTLEINIK